jgi:hypothetical protein
MKSGAPARPVLGICLGIVLSLMLLGEAWIISHNGGGFRSIILLWCIFLLFLLVLLAIFFMFRRLRAGTVQLTREGLSLPVGLRPLFLEWGTISEIKEITFKGKPYVGMKLKSLDDQRKAIQYLAKANEEHTGCHLVLGSAFFEEPPGSMVEILRRYAGDDKAREALPPRSQEP